MISKDTLQLNWIRKVSTQNRKADKILVEKVIRALFLIEGLAQSGMPFIFKGGTAVMLLLRAARRFSIDIDIVVPARTNFEAIFTKFLVDKGFTRFTLQERSTTSTIEKLHYKFFYSPAYRTSSEEDNVLLDIIVETPRYRNIAPVSIASPFVKLEGAPVTVNIPSKEDLLADKLTAFAPNASGIPYEKGGFSRAMEIVKQLYDIGNIFEEISDLSVVAKTFNTIALTELGYRGLAGGAKIVLDDITGTALCLSTGGKAGKGDFDALQGGVSKIKAYIYSERYQIEKAIVHASRAAYCAKLIESGENTIVRFENPEQITDWKIEPPLDTRLNKLRKTNPEAFFYWYQVYLLAKQQEYRNETDFVVER